MDKEKLRVRLFELRKGKGLTLEQLGAGIGVPKGSVSHWETGTRIPTLDYLWRLADFYDISLDELVGRKP